MFYYEVAISKLPLLKTFVYKSSEKLLPGERVLVDFRRNKVVGYVLKETKKRRKAKNILQRLDDGSFLTEKHITLAFWMSEFYGSPIGMIMDLFFPRDIGKYTEEYVESLSPLLNFKRVRKKEFIKLYGEEMLNNYLKSGIVRLRKEVLVKMPKPRLKKRVFLRKKIQELLKISLPPRQKEIIDYLIFHNGVLLNELVYYLGVSRGTVFSLVEKGIIEIKEDQGAVAPPETMEKDRLMVAESCKEVGKHLVFGPTGSGKTEVYLEVLRSYLNEGSAIYLVPETSLTPSIIARIKGKFPDIPVGVYHSYLTRARRVLEWFKAVKGETKILVGSRSALFVPMKDLRIIIVDEEHDESYYQRSEPVYDAVKVAEKMGELFGLNVIFGSATPRLDHYASAKKGEMKFHILKGRALGELPEVEIVDMRREERIGSFSKTVLDEMEKTLNRREKILIFSRRKGFSGYVKCEECGYVVKCKNCDVSMSYHSSKNVFKCHQCGYEIPAFGECPVCGGRLTPFGTGTERIERELVRFFPGMKIARIDREVIEKPHEVQRYLNGLQEGKIDILVGTKMITKGLDIPNIGLVCVLDVDGLLFIPDYTTNIRTFQLLVQVFGRSGRRGRGKAIIQTWNPDDPVLIFASKHDVSGYYDLELERRKELSYPPYSHLIHVILESSNPLAGWDLVKTVVDKLRDSYNTLGPSEHPIFKLRGLYRHHFIVKVDTPESFLKDLQKVLKIYKGSWKIFVDPPGIV
ncbi:MAG: primosomal protein N' [Thermotogae bacterium]|nr:MAG: primosomal protein N' [Thermotogota bacterium]